MGGIIPITTRLLIRLNKANRITISPAALKKMPDFAFFLILNELKLTRAKIGKVPKAKANMVSPPFKKLPVERVYSCID